MKIYNKFVESKKEPSNKNDIWFDGSTIRLYKEGEWYTVTLSKEAIERLLQYAENVDIFKYVDELPEVGDPTFIYFKKEESDGSLIVLPYVYDGEWKQITNTEIFSKTSPFGFGEAENSAILKGGGNEATNINEVALGKYNQSSNDTLFSIGIGSSDNDRKNAFEVKQNGDIYIEGVEKPIQIKLTELENKVDKEEGKGLSSNDFTNALKEKLEGLENYDDAEISSAVEKLSRDFNALLGNNASTAIESFNEIIAFLEGIEDSASLDAIVASIQQEIAKVSNGLADTDAKLTNLSEKVEENEVLIEDLQNTKIDKEADDYYPQMSVGLADNLAGVDVVASEVSFRRSGGGAISDGVARIESIKGNSVVWNQKVRSALDSNGELGWWRRSSMDAIELSGNKVTIKPNQVSLGVSQQITQNVNFIANHKYLVVVDYAAPDDTICRSLEIHQQGDKNGSTAKRINSILNPIKGHSESFHTAVADMPYLSIYFFEPTVFVSAEIEATVIDLTLMFGVGNEPTTIEDFNARKPISIDENAYNEGEVIHMDAQSLESVGVNQWDEEWALGSINSNGQDVADETRIRSKGYIRVLPNKEYAITHPLADDVSPYFYDNQYNFIKSGAWTNSGTPFLVPEGAMYMRFKMAAAYGGVYKNDISVNISDTSINGKYFPFIKRIQSLDIIGKYFPKGMRSAGTAHDEIRYNKVRQKWEKVQRIGEVELGTLSYSKSDIGANAFYTLSLQGKVKNSGKLLTSQFYQVPGITSSRDAEMSVDSTGVIHFSLFAHTDAASFKAAMQGVILYYELAEPIVTELDDDFNLDYEVWNSGTEEVISDVPTTPLKADIAYGFNAVGKIKELEEKKVNKTDLATINGQRIDEGGNIEIEGGSPYDDTEIRQEITELSAEVSGLSERVDALGEGGSSVFEAIYGETTYDELVAAVKAKKHVICFYKNKVYNLCNYQEGKDIFFSCVTSAVYTLQCLASTGKWATPSQYSYEMQSLKVTSLSDKSTDTQYPSAKAVYDAIQQSGGAQGVISQTLNYNSDDNTYSVSDVVRGSIPSFFIDLVTEAGASFNAESGYFSLNGIDNIAYDEMRQIYNCRTGYGVNSLLAVYGQTYTARTNFAAFRGFAISFSNHQPTTIYTKYLCSKNASMTKFVIHNESQPLCVRADCVNNFNGVGTGYLPIQRSRLEEIIGIIDVENLANSANFFYSGTYQPWLTSFQLKSLKASIDLSGMPRLSEATILYMINNEKATAAITIKLHADAKAMADASEAIQSALSNHANITLGV